MEQEHLIIIAILAVILYMLMKHSSNCNCSSCMKDKAIGGYSTSMPAHIRMIANGPPGPEDPYHIRVRHSDKYIGAGQHIKQHIRYDSRQGMFNGMFSGSPQHIREGFDACDADPCAAGCPRAGTC
jgi:hypothetical protein